MLWSDLVVSSLAVSQTTSLSGSLLDLCLSTDTVCFGSGRTSWSGTCRWLRPHQLVLCLLVVLWWTVPPLGKEACDAWCIQRCGIPSNHSWVIQHIGDRNLIHLIAWRRLAVCSRNVAIYIQSDYIVKQTITFLYLQLNVLLLWSASRAGPLTRFRWTTLYSFKSEEKLRLFCALYAGCDSCMYFGRRWVSLEMQSLTVEVPHMYAYVCFGV